MAQAACTASCMRAARSACLQSGVFTCNGAGLRAEPRACMQSSLACVQWRVHACCLACLRALWNVCVQSRVYACRPVCTCAEPFASVQSSVLACTSRCTREVARRIDAIPFASMQSLGAHVQRRLLACSSACVHADSFASLHVKVFGCSTIELDEDPGVPDGQQVELQIQIEPTERKWGEGIPARGYFPFNSAKRLPNSR